MYAKNEKNISRLCFSKNNSNCKKQVILLMIPNGKGWYYLAVKKKYIYIYIYILALLTGITSKHYDNFYCLKCLHSFRTKSKLESHKKVCENKYFCNIIMPSQDTKILEFNLKIDGCKNNSSTTEVSKHILLGYSLFTISPFRSIENKHDVYRGKDWMKMFCESLREHVATIINFKKKKKWNY